MIDIIGDIHGHARELITLLNKLGYSLNNNFYSHPERKALFVGDYIDRGSQIKETLEIVKAMADNGSAIALMGNHEYNAICFDMENKNGGHLREHSIKNIGQHYDTLNQFKGHQKEYDKYIEWFKTLPLFYEDDSIRAVHACWDEEKIEYLRNTLIDGKYLNDELIRKSTIENSSLFNAVEITLKGKELELPEGEEFNDKDGNERKEIRIKWWENPNNLSYYDLALGKVSDRLKDVKTDASTLSSYYPENDKPVFFGHYWQVGELFIHKKNVCGVDFSVAKGGSLVAYRYDNEEVLNIVNMEKV